MKVRGEPVPVEERLQPPRVPEVTSVVTMPVRCAIRRLGNREQPERMASVRGTLRVQRRGQGDWDEFR